MKTWIDNSLINGGIVAIVFTIYALAKLLIVGVTEEDLKHE